jgi:hypothetical protein
VPVFPATLRHLHQITLANPECDDELVAPHATPLTKIAGVALLVAIEPLLSLAEGAERVTSIYES